MFAVVLAPPALLNHYHLTGVTLADGTRIDGKHKIYTLCVLGASAVRKANKSQ